MSRRKLNAEEKRALKAGDLQLFIKEYGRKAQKGVEPNDRRYSRKVEDVAKRLSPDELDKLLRLGEEDI